MTAIGGAPPWAGPGPVNGAPERRFYTYRGNKPLTPEQRARAEQGLAELAATQRGHGALPRSRQYGWAATADDV